MQANTLGVRVVPTYDSILNDYLLNKKYSEYLLAVIRLQINNQSVVNTESINLSDFIPKLKNLTRDYNQDERKVQYILRIMDHPLLEPKVLKNIGYLKNILEVVEKVSLSSIPFSEVTIALWDIGVQLEAFKMLQTVSCVGITSILFKWAVIQTITQNYMIFLHVRDSNGKNLIVGDATPSHLGREYPTSKWVQGDVIMDEHTLLFRSDIAPGNYTLKVGFTKFNRGYWKNVLVRCSTEYTTEFTLPNLIVTCPFS